MAPKKKAKRADGDEGSSKKARVQDSPALFEHGTSVKLMNAARCTSHINLGDIGEVAGYEDDDRLYEVVLPRGRIWANRADLLPCYEVTVTGLEGRPELNGKRGTIDGWDAERERYEVALRDLETPRVKLQPKNVLLPHGARVKVHGLVGAPQHNGHLAQITDYLDEAGRYTVEYINNELETLTQVRPKRENVRLI